MKYIEPTIEIAIFETEEVITASKQYCEVENEGDGKGKVTFSAFGLFS